MEVNCGSTLLEFCQFSVLIIYTEVMTHKDTPLVRMPCEE
jgi:hypothetical protein